MNDTSSLPAAVESRSALGAASAARLAGTLVFAAFACFLAPATGCDPDRPGIAGMWDCNPLDACCVNRVCQEGLECWAGGKKAECRFNGSILAASSCICSIVPGGGNTNIPEVGYSMSDFVADLHEADFEPYSPEQVQFFQSGCNAGLGKACVGLAVLHALSPNQNLSAAAAAAQQACAMGDEEGCYFLAAAYATGSGVQHDPAMANMLFAQSCQMGVQLACEGASSIPDAMAIIETRLQ